MLIFMAWIFAVVMFVYGFNKSIERKAEHTIITPQEIEYLEEIRSKGIKQFCKVRVEEIPPPKINNSLVELFELWKADKSKVETGDIKVDFPCWLLEVSPDYLYEYAEVRDKIGFSLLKEFFDKYDREDIDNLLNKPRLTAANLLGITPKEVVYARKLSRSKDSYDDVAKILLKRLGLGTFKYQTLREAHFFLMDEDIKKLSSADTSLIKLFNHLYNVWDEIATVDDKEHSKFNTLLLKIEEAVGNISQYVDYGNILSSSKDLADIAKAAISMSYMLNFENESKKTSDKKESKYRETDVEDDDSGELLDFIEKYQKEIETETETEKIPIIMEGELIPYKIRVNHNHAVHDYKLDSNFANEARENKNFVAIIPFSRDTLEDDKKSTFPFRDETGKMISSVQIFETGTDGNIGSFVGLFRVSHNKNGSVTLSKANENNQPLVIYTEINLPEDTSFLEEDDGEGVVINFSRSYITRLGYRNGTTILLYDSTTYNYIGEWTANINKDKQSEVVKVKPTRNSLNFSKKEMLYLKNVKSSKKIRSLAKFNYALDTELMVYSNEPGNDASVYKEKISNITGNPKQNLFVADYAFYEEVCTQFTLPSKVTVIIDCNYLGDFIIDKHPSRVNGIKFTRPSINTTTSQSAYKKVVSKETKKDSKKSSVKDKIDRKHEAYTNQIV